MASARPSVKQSVNEKGEISVEKVKVPRYRAGKAPEFAPNDDADADDVLAARDRKDRGGSSSSSSSASALSKDDINDPRLRRLMQSRRPIYEGEVVSAGRRRQRDDEDEQEDSGGDGADAHAAAEHRRAAAAADNAEDEDDDERRERLRRRAQLQRQQEADELARLEEEQQEEDEEESEYEEESEEEFTSMPLLKPVFVPKSERVTSDEKARAEIEEEKLEAERRRKLEERRKDTYQLVTEAARTAEGAVVDANVLISTPDMVDDTDGLNEEEEYEQWKLRELKRIKRDKEEQMRIKAEQADVERRRNMTDAERRAEDAADPEKQAKDKEKAKYRFLQKYYHKGAFFQQLDVVKERDFSEATERDAINKELLPKVMQVKNFGRSGQTKYTHLLDQDTTKNDSAWAEKSTINLRTVNKLAGYNNANTFDKPTGKKRKI